MKIKTFIGTPIQCEEQINEFLKENNLKLLNLYSDGFVEYSYDDKICNQWHETTIFYELLND